MGNHQTTGSITLDIDAIAAAVVREIRPLIGAGGDETLSVLDAADVVRDHLPKGIVPVTTMSAIADHLSEALTDAGYRLVHVGKKTPGQRAEDWFAPGRRD